MTIDEAISHALEVAGEQQETDWTLKLVEWLTELKDLRAENKVLISECDRLIKEKGELLKKLYQHNFGEEYAEK